MTTGTPKAKKSSSTPKSAAQETPSSHGDTPKRRATPALPARPPRNPNNPRNTDDLLLAGGSGAGTRFGRCGGRAILSRLERDLCDRLTGFGVAHSHRPRHFEVKLEDESLAAYAPCMVLRGRGREGKTVVVETSEIANDAGLTKIRAFRRQYGLEFYVCFVAPEELLDDVHFDVYDEATAATDVHTLVSRLAD